MLELASALANLQLELTRKYEAELPPDLSTIAAFATVVEQARLLVNPAAK